MNIKTFTSYLLTQATESKAHRDKESLTGKSYQWERASQNSPALNEGNAN